MNFIDETGNRHGRLTVLGLGTSPNREIYWLCQCDCGSQVTVRGSSLRRGTTRSCGCLQREVSSRVLVSLHEAGLWTTHGHTRGRRKSRTYRSWASMIARVTNPSNDRFQDYGGRGITVCNRWRAFENFLDDMGERPDGMSLDRIDNDGNYEPGNCRWATPRQQQRNSRRYPTQVPA